MNSSRCSRLLIVVALLVLSAGVAGGVSVNDQAIPTGAIEGERVEASFVFTEPFQNPNYEQWTLETRTELRNVTWTFRFVDQAGNVRTTNSVDGQNVTQSVNIENGVNEIHVDVVGEVPAVEEFTYDPPPSFVLAGFLQVREGGTSSTIEVFGARHYTAESQDAREAIQSAEAAIEAAGGNAEAEATLQNAISAYEGENFENAVSLAQQAEARATQAQQAEQRNRLIIYGVVALVVILLVVGAIYWYRSRQTSSRL